MLQGTHCTGKTAKKKGNLEILPKHREFGFAQVVNALILKVKIFQYLSRTFLGSWISLPSQFCVCNSHKSGKLSQGKFVVGQGKHREFENAI